MRKAGLLLFATLLMLLSACSGKMDKQTASEEIQGVFDGGHNTVLVRVGRIGVNCGIDPDTGNVRDYGDPAKSTDTKIIEAAGYLTVKPDGKNYWNVNLTDKGKAVIDAGAGKLENHETGNGCDSQLASFLIARPVLLQVGEIEGKDKAAVVYYSFEWKATELGAGLRADGAIFNKLTDLERSEFNYGQRLTAAVQVLHLPVPPEGKVQYDSMAFIHGDNGWRVMVTPRF